MGILFNKIDFNLHDHFYYDASSRSCLRSSCDVLCGHRRSTLKVRTGDSVGGYSKAQNRYVVIVSGKSILAHRVVWELHNGAIPDGLIVDHINGDASDNRIENLRCVKSKINNRNVSKRNGTSTCGVRVERKVNKHGKEYFYWQAHWKTLEGNTCNKNFSIAKLGDADAYRMACEYREMQIRLLNESGAGYTERHGT
jgi:hypothetical protein